MNVPHGPKSDIPLWQCLIVLRTYLGGHCTWEWITLAAHYTGTYPLTLGDPDVVVSITDGQSLSAGRSGFLRTLHVDAQHLKVKLGISGHVLGKNVAACPLEVVVMAVEGDVVGVAVAPADTCKCPKRWWPCCSSEFVFEHSKWLGILWADF